MAASATAPVVRVDHGAEPAAGPGEEHDRLGPTRGSQVAPTSAGRRRRPPPPRARERRRRRPPRCPAVRTTRRTPVPSASAPPATGGRFGPEPHDVLAAEQHPHRRGRAGRPARGRRRPPGWPSLPPNAPPLASGDDGLAAGLAPRRRRARGSRAPPSDVRSVAAQSPGGSSSGGRASTVVRRPCTLPAGGAGLGQRVADGPAAVAVGHGHQRVRPGRCRRRSPRARARRPGATALRRAALERGSLRGPRTRTRRRFACPSVRNIDGFAVRALSPVATSHASRIVRHPVQRQRWARRACSTAGWPSGPAAAPLARRPSSRQTMPGVQNPHWLAPVAQNASAQRSRVASGQAVDRRDRPPRHPPGRGHAGDPRLAVDQHRAAPALPLRAAPVLGRAQPEVLAQHLEQGRAPVGDLDLPAVDLELQRRAISGGHREQDRFAGMAGPPPGPLPTPLPRRRPAPRAGAVAARRVRRRTTTTKPTPTAHDATSPATASSCSPPYLRGPFYVTGIAEPGHRSGWPTAQGLLTLEDTPEELEVTSSTPTARREADPSRSSATPRACPVRTSRSGDRSTTPGIYTCAAEPRAGRPPRWPSRCRTPRRPPMVKPGDRDARRSLTPTAADARGVDPICTARPRLPAARRHARRRARRRASRSRCSWPRPAFCQVAICGPVLDVLLDARWPPTRTAAPARRGLRRPRRRTPTATTPRCSTDARHARSSRRCSWSAPTASWPSASTRSTTRDELDEPLAGAQLSG